MLDVDRLGGLLPRARSRGRGGNARVTTHMARAGQCRESAPPHKRGDKNAYEPTSTDQCAVHATKSGRSSVSGTLSQHQISLNPSSADTCGCVGEMRVGP